MRLLFTADLHGKVVLYKKMFDIALREKVATILLGGDLLPTKIGKPMGLITGNIDFNISLNNQIMFIDRYMKPLFDEFMVKAPKTPILYIPGNHDWQAAIEYMRDKIHYAVYLHGRTEVVHGICFTGYGCVTDSFFWVKDFVRRDTISEKKGKRTSRYPCLSTGHGIIMAEDTRYLVERPSIEEEIATLEITEPLNTVFMFHDPPFDTGLDTLFTGKPIGSKAIRKFIEKREPLISLHGHIHEAPYISRRYWSKINNTISVNPGHDGDILHAVILDTDDPTGSLYHSIFGKSIPTKPWLKASAERHIRSIKSRLGNMILSKYA